MRQPVNSLLNYGYKVERRCDDGEKERAKSKYRRAAISPPSTATVDKESPDGESESEDEQQSGIENITYGVAEIQDDLRTG